VQLGAPIPGSDQTSLTERLPVDLRDNAADVRFDAVPFTWLHRTHDEFAAEISNRTVHTVMHVGGPGRARDGTGRDGRRRQTTWRVWQGLHGVHQAGPVPHRLSGAHAAHRTRVDGML
jgi:hypothetical protein